MPFKGNRSLTPDYALSKNKRGKKMTTYIGGRSVFEKEVGEDMSDAVLGVFQMLDDSSHWEHIDGVIEERESKLNEKIEKEGYKEKVRLKRMDGDLLFKKQSQSVRCKPSKSRTKKDPRYVDDVINELGKEVNGDSWLGYKNKKHDDEVLQQEEL